MNRPANDPERLSATLALVCEAWGVPEDALITRRRVQEYADPRSAFYHVTHAVMQFGTCHIARWLGNRDHSTVVYGSRRGCNLMETDRRFRSRVEWVIEQMKQRGIV
jgi:chromosomal replication initiation ATPase DnaA